MSNLKNIHYIHILCSPHGGLITYLEGFIDAQKSKSCDITLVANKNICRKNILEKFNNYKKKLMIKSFINIKTHKLPNHEILGDIFRIYYYLKSIKLKNKRICIIAHGTSSSIILILISLIFKADFIFIPHGGISHFIHSTNDIKKLFFWFFDFIVRKFRIEIQPESRYTLKSYTDFYKNNNIKYKFLRKEYLYSFPKNLKYKMEIFDRKNNSPKSKTNYLEILYLGTWREIKGSYQLWEVLKTFKKSDFQFKNKILRFTFITDFKNHRLGKHTHENIIFKPWEDKISKFINKYHIQIIPSKKESFGYVGIEALVYRIKIIHTNQGGLKEIFKNTKMPTISENFNKSELLNSIKYLDNKNYNELINPDFNLISFIKNSYWTRSI